MTSSEAFEKLKRFCDYRERCHSEVRTKLLSLKVYGHQLEEVMSLLIDEGYLNEERYARSYVRGKFRINRWGRTKIVNQLKAMHISDYCITKGLTEIDADEYLATLHDVLSKYAIINNGYSKPMLLKKLSHYGINKGYEINLVNTIAQEIVNK